MPLMDSNARAFVDPSIALRDLRSLLRKKFDDRLDLVSFEMSPLLPPGENYGSTISRVRAIIRKGPDEEEEDLHLVAKMIPTSEFQTGLFDIPFIFRKEIFLYEDLLPFYRRLQEELGMRPVLEIAPEFYGARLSLKPGGDYFDEDAVLLMENLKVRDFYTADRLIGLDLIHSKKTIEALASFHAIGMAVKYKKPDYFEKLKNRLAFVEIRLDELHGMEDLMIKSMCDDPELSAYSAQIKANMTENIKNYWTATPTEPWSSIIHADFWINNIMFHRDANGIVDNVKFIDFQDYRFASPLREIIFFLCVNLKLDVMEEHFDDLMNFYYDALISQLEMMQCDVTALSRESFDAQLKIDAPVEFPHCAFMIKISTTSETDDGDKNKDMLASVLASSGKNITYITKLRKFVRKYIDKGWMGV